MAIRVQKGRKSPFVVYWLNPFTGRRESKACATRPEAEKLDDYVKYQLRHERETFRRQEQETRQPAIVQTLESVMYLYLRARQLAVGNLAKTLDAIKEILATHGDTAIDTLDAGHLKAMQDAMTARLLSPATIHRRMGIVKAALRWAEAQGIVETVPRFPAVPTVRHTRIVPPTPEEVAALYAAASPPLQRVIVLGYYLGMRVGPSELLKLTWADIDLAAAVVRVPNADKGNADPWREVPITPDVAALLTRWHQEDTAAGIAHVVHQPGGKPVQSIKTAWRTAKRRAGITRRLRPYDLRHGFATQLIARGADVGTVAALMGHASPVMTLRHYQHVLTAQKQRAVEALPPLPECVQDDVFKQ